MIVLDTSAWLKRVLRHEPDAERVEALVGAHLRRQQQILVPYVAWAEALYVLRERLKLPWADVRQGVRLLWFPRLKVIPPSRRLLLASIQAGEQYGIDNPDSIFVAAAALRRCDLVTADGPMFRRMRGRGIGWVHLLRDYAV